MPDRNEPWSSHPGLELVVLGEKFIPADVGLALLDARPQGDEVGFGLSAVTVPANDDLGGKSLSGREAQILHLITQGASNKVIARDLGLAEATVKVHVKAILRKVKVSNRTQAAMWAQRHVNGRRMPSWMQRSDAVNSKQQDGGPDGSDNSHSPVRLSKR